MYNKFYIGDIVKLKEDEEVLHMVVDIADFTEEPKKGRKPVIDIDYDLMQIYPIKQYSLYSIWSQPDLMLHIEKGGRNYNMLLNFIQKDREKMGWFGTPDFIQTANNNLEAIKKSLEKAENRVEVKSKEVKVSMKRMDDIRYDLINNIDTCLDALNHLDILYQMFGDESYLQLKEVVCSRLVILSR